MVGGWWCFLELVVLALEGDTATSWLGQVRSLTITRHDQSINRSIETVLSNFIFGVICIEGRELRFLSFLVRILLELRPKDNLATEGVRKDAMRYFEKDDEEEDEEEDKKEDEEMRIRTG